MSVRALARWIFWPFWNSRSFSIVCGVFSTCSLCVARACICLSFLQSCSRPRPPASAFAGKLVSVNPSFDLAFYKPVLSPQLCPAFTSLCRARAESTFSRRHLLDATANADSTAISNGGNANANSDATAIDNGGGNANANADSLAVSNGGNANANSQASLQLRNVYDRSFVARNNAVFGSLVIPQLSCKVIVSGLERLSGTTQAAHSSSGAVVWCFLPEGSDMCLVSYLLHLLISCFGFCQPCLAALTMA